MVKVTIKDIAKELNISTATVSRVLSNKGYASQEIRERVLETAKRLNYQPNLIARSLKKHQTNTIGVILPDISNPYFMTISRGMEDTVQQHGYHLIFASGDDSPKKERDMLQVLYKQRVDAIVLAPSGANLDYIEEIKNAGVPVIFVDRNYDNDPVRFDYVIEDNVKGAYQLTKYLIQQGHRDIGIVTGPLSISTAAERFKGFQKALAEFGMKENPAYIYKGDYSKSTGYEAAKWFLDRKEGPTAIFSSNNHITFGILRRLAEYGLSRFEHLTIASYGENEAAQLLDTPKIISVKQSPYEMGVKVGEILIDRLIHHKEDPVYKKFDPIFRIPDEYH